MGQLTFEYIPIDQDIVLYRNHCYEMMPEKRKIYKEGELCRDSKIKSMVENVPDDGTYMVCQSNGSAYVRMYHETELDAFLGQFVPVVISKRKLVRFEQVWRYSPKKGNLNAAPEGAIVVQLGKKGDLSRWEKELAVWGDAKEPEGSAQIYKEQNVGTFINGKKIEQMGMDKDGNQIIYVESSIWNGIKTAIKVLWYGGVVVLILVGIKIVGI